LVTVAKVVGVTPAVLQSDLAAGQTLLQIAAGRYASADALATALAAGIKAKLAAAVAAGKMTAAQAADIYTQAHAAFAKLAVTPHPALSTGTTGAGTGARVKTAIQISMPDMESVLATACQTTAAALEAARQAGGQSILAICQRTNPSATAESLVAALTAAIKAKLDTLVTAGQLTAAQESDMLAAMRTKLTYLVTSVPPAGGAAK
jgi:hypothetical protein